tara:strand:+ start:1393 stop:1857 length:465 start_codon:yes stop_codon:yes gene_type:complete
MRSWVSAERKNRKRIYSKEGVFREEGGGVRVVFTVDEYFEMEYQVNGSTKKGEAFPLGVGAKILFWIRREVIPEIAAEYGGRYPVLWGVAHDNDGQGGRREKGFAGFHQLKHFTYDGENIHYYGDNIETVKMLYDSSPEYHEAFYAPIGATDKE